MSVPGMTGYTDNVFDLEKVSHQSSRSVGGQLNLERAVHPVDCCRSVTGRG